MLRFTSLKTTLGGVCCGDAGRQWRSGIIHVGDDCDSDSRRGKRRGGDYRLVSSFWKRKKAFTRAQVGFRLI